LFWALDEENTGDSCFVVEEQGQAQQSSLGCEAEIHNVVLSIATDSESDSNSDSDSDSGSSSEWLDSTIEAAQGWRGREGDGSFYRDVSDCIRVIHIDVHINFFINIFNAIDGSIKANLVR